MQRTKLIRLSILVLVMPLSYLAALSFFRSRHDKSDPNLGFVRLVRFTYYTDHGATWRVDRRISNKGETFDELEEKVDDAARKCHFHCDMRGSEYVSYSGDHDRRLWIMVRMGSPDIYYLRKANGIEAAAGLLISYFE